MEPHTDGSAGEADDEEGRVVWLFDPDATPDGGTLSCSPTELFARLAAAVDRAGLGSVAVTGVVTGLRRRGRWASFELAEHRGDAETAVAIVRVVLFASVLPAVDAALADQGRELRDGMGATVTGEVSFDAPWGSCRIVGRTVVAHEERAEVAARRDALVAELAASGALDAQRALVVPGRPVRIGVIAGAGTAAAADIDAVLDGSGLEWRVLRRSVPMAGPTAPAAVAKAVSDLSRSRPDVIVVARGGGGRGELACFDAEVVARAIASCPVPVWAAIGHASDATVADRVANRSCPTPSAAAHALVERVRAFEQRRHERVVLRAHADQMRAVEERTRRARLVALVAVVAFLVLAMLVLR